MSNAPRDARAKRDWGSDDSATPILHVDMDSFFAQVEMCEDPSLIGRPIIVGGTSGRGVVTSATYEARALGVRAGMPTSRARALCPSAAFIPGNHCLYQRYSRQVMAILATVTPDLEQVSIDEAFLDVSGARRRLGSPTQIAHLIRSRIRKAVGLPASVGIAATKSVAKIASSHAKPDGLLLIPQAPSPPPRSSERRCRADALSARTATRPGPLPTEPALRRTGRGVHPARKNPRRERSCKASSSPTCHTR